MSSVEDNTSDITLKSYSFVIFRGKIARLWATCFIATTKIIHEDYCFWKTLVQCTYTSFLEFAIRSAHQNTCNNAVNIPFSFVHFQCYINLFLIKHL